MEKLEAEEQTTRKWNVERMNEVSKAKAEKNKLRMDR